MHSDQDRDEIGIGHAHRRFGGFDTPAALAGLFGAIGLTVLLGGLASAAGSYGYQRGVDRTDLSLGGMIAGLAVLLVAFLFGGWVAGRMARYDGVRNGVLMAVLFIVMMAGISVLGAWADDRYDFFDEVRLPQWFNDISTAGAFASAVAGAFVMILAGALGGRIGARYHRRADEMIAGTHHAIVSAPGEAELSRSDERRHADH